MSRRAFIALADDLTGAAELAAIGHRMGLRSVVCTEGQTPGRHADLTVYDTDSRLCAPDEAARRVRATLQAVMARDSTATIYKKVDSILRGPVATELAAAAEVLGKLRVLLVPGNPSLGRTVQQGIYRLQGVPVAETAFARDPHHPVVSSRVTEMLGENPSLPVTTASIDKTALPTGIVVGDATSISDLDTWANRLGNGTLAAGGAGFFAAWLRSRGCWPLPTSAFPVLSLPVLIIVGSTAPASQANLVSASAAGAAIVQLPESVVTSSSPADRTPLLAWIDTVAKVLQERKIVIASAINITSTAPEASDAIRHAFASLSAQLYRRGAFKHLIVEGGATAAAAARALGWRELAAIHEWAPGVASLRPALTSDILFTIKPGSYAWPDDLWRQFVAVRPTVTPV